MTSPEANRAHSYPLPVVTLETGKSALQDLSESRENEYLLYSFDMLLEENPVAARLVLAYIEGTSNTEREEFVAKQAIALLHELLRKQSAASELDGLLSI